MDHVIAKMASSSALRVGFLASIDPHSARHQRCEMMRRLDPAAIIVAFATEYGRYGYRRIAAMLRDAGLVARIKRVEPIWRREGLKVPQKQPKRGRLWLNDGWCIRLWPLYPNHIWSYDFVEDRTTDGRKYRMLNVIDEFTCERLAIRETESSGRPM